MSKPKGVDRRIGLSALVEKFCSKTILKMKVTKEGAYSAGKVSIWVGVIKTIKKKINSSKE